VPGGRTIRGEGYGPPWLRPRKNRVLRHPPPRASAGPKTRACVKFEHSLVQTSGCCVYAQVMLLRSVPTASKLCLFAALDLWEGRNPPLRKCKYAQCLDGRLLHSVAWSGPCPGLDPGPALDLIQGSPEWRSLPNCVVTSGVFLAEMV
jgi:hypothetical protein